MGSRGQALKTGGFTAYNYKTLMRYGNTRFVMQRDKTKSVKVPEVANSPWAVYATISKKGDLQSVSFFNGSRRKYKEIDLIWPHNGLLPHVHIIDPNAVRMRNEDNYRPLTNREAGRLREIQEFFKEHDLKTLYEREVQNERNWHL